MLSQRIAQHGFARNLIASVALLGATTVALGQGNQVRIARLTDPIDETKLVTLTGNTHPLAIAKYDLGAAPDSMPLQHMYLQLKRSAEQEQALHEKLKEMQTSGSPSYHHWLTAEELGKSYGPAQQDIDTVVSWLAVHGLQVNGVSKTGLTIDVSGTVSQLRDAFHTQIHTYSVKGKQHIANASDPVIPAALAPAVAGFNSLNSFLPKSLLTKRKSDFSFDYETFEQYDEAPSDLATIYNVTPLYKAKRPITGKGQTVVVLEDTDIKPSDVATFRKAFDLTSYSGTFAQIHPGSGCTDPGKNGAEGEAALDAEWAGAVAPDAKVELASCADTETNFGAFIAAQNLLDEATPPPIMSLSYGSCEAAQGPSGNLYIEELWEQAALEGVSVFVSTGDGGPAGCDDPDTETYAIGGIAANALASTPFNTATGGTDFLDTAEGENSEYWSTTNSKAGESAKSYVPEMTWNDSCASSVLYTYLGAPNGISLCNTGAFLDIIGGSGAPSFVYAKPYWQENVYGNPSDGVRDLPDVSLFASNGFWSHAILFCMSDPAEGGAPCNYSNPTDAYYNSAGGTSFTAPQLASIQALINQKAGGPQGNPAPIYYDLGKLQYGLTFLPNKLGIDACNASSGNEDSKACLFHDVTTGNTDVPCYGTNDCYGSAGLSYGVLSTSDKKLKVAFPAASGWDFTSGLGSLNVTNVVLVWP